MRMILEYHDVGFVVDVGVDEVVLGMFAASKVLLSYPQSSQLNI